MPQTGINYRQVVVSVCIVWLEFHRSGQLEDGFIELALGSQNVSEVVVSL